MPAIQPHTDHAAAILLIEDHRDIAQLVSMHLADQDMTVEHAGDGTLGLSKALDNAHQLIILDLMLPGLDGLELCRQLRTQGCQTPVLMLTARSTELDRVLGLEIGADDYLTKPFSVRELVARVKAILRRVTPAATTTSGPRAMLQTGDLSVDQETREVQLAGQDVQLTAREFDLLTHFMRHPGRVFSRGQLLDQVWGYSHSGYEHTVNSHINRLRAKIESEPARPQFIRTVRGVGYKFAPADHATRH